jgi:hypothetical protein
MMPGKHKAWNKTFMGKCPRCGLEFKLTRHTMPGRELVNERLTENSELMMKILDVFKTKMETDAKMITTIQPLASDNKYVVYYNQHHDAFAEWFG